jgi:glycogen(starch) synthase
MGKKQILLGPFPPPFGGVSIFMRALFDLSKGRGIRAWNYGRLASEENVRHIKIRRLGIVPALLSEGFKARIIETAHFHLEYPNAILLPIWLAFKVILRFEWVKILHDGSLPSRYSGFGFVQRLLFRLAVRSVTEFVVVSEDLGNWLKNSIGVSQRISHIPSLLPVSTARLNAKIPGELQQALAGFRSCQRRIISIGAFIPSYGFKHVAQAVERIRNESGVDIGLLLIDANFARDEEFRADVLDGREWITVLEEAPHSAIYSILRESDLFVRGFQLESYGISRIEALWSGIPVIATNVGETRGMRLYEFGDIPELVRQIKESLDQPFPLEARLAAERFHIEAAENFDRYMKVIDGNIDIAVQTGNTFDTPSGRGTSGAPI